MFLHFGEPRDYENGLFGTVLLSGASYPLLDVIKIAVIDIVDAYEACSPNDNESSVNIGVGLNSDGYHTSYDHGAAWANLLVDINAEIVRLHPLSNVMALGAINIEPGFNTPQDTEPWVEGYDSVSPRFSLYIIASADACPIDSYFLPGTCYNSWTQDTISRLFWEPGVNWLIPEIYETSGVHAKQWRQIALSSAYYNDRNLTFSGSLTQAAACAQVLDAWYETNNQYWYYRWVSDCYELNNSPQSGYMLLYDQLNSDEIINNMVYSLDMKHFKGVIQP